MRLVLEREGYSLYELRVESGYPCVTGAINGKTVNFLVDTGSPSTCLDSKTTGRVKLNWEGLEGWDRNGKPARRLKHADVPSMQVGKLSTGPFRVYDDDFSDSNRVLASRGQPLIEGTLGADVLSYFGAVIDYRSRHLYLMAPPEN